MARYPPVSLPGRIIYHLWHRPVGAARECLRAGGPFEQRRTARGQTVMEAVAHTLPPIAHADGHPLELHLMTGARFWYQTVFCLWSFARHAGRSLAPVIYDDGTLAAVNCDGLRRLFPSIRFESRAAIRTRLETHLPRSRYPVLRARADEFPLLHKIIDPHAGSTGWKLFIDSDLLFFRRPALLINWIDHPENPLHARDIQNAYGYPLSLLRELAGQPVAERVNTGLLGLRSETIDWDRMEFWCRELQTRVGSHYYQEQALVALLLAGQNCVIAPLSDYVTLPERPEVFECRAVMHHYVAHSKRWYFQECWRRAMQLQPGIE